MTTASWLVSIWNSPDRLSSWITFANIGIAIALLVTFALTVFTIAATVQKEALQKIEDAKNQEKIANANATAAAAHERAASSDAAAAQARADSARAVVGQKELELQTELARKEQEQLRKQNLELQSKVEAERTARLKLEEQLAPRRLTDTQKELIGSVLRSLPRQNVMIMTIMNSVEAAQYADSFKRLIESSGWTANGVNHGMFTPVAPLGIWILVKDGNAAPLAAHALAKALSNAGIEFQGAINPSLQAGDVELRIGAKP